MNKERWERIDRILQEALSRPPESRDAHVVRECGSDLELRNEVVSLLKASSEVGGFLDESPVLLGKGNGLSGDGLGAIPKSIGNYRVLRRLGEGGMGVVYLAEQSRPQRQVAIKVMRLDATGSNTHARFEREAEALGRLKHPGIAQIYEAANEANGVETRAFIAMEFVEGPTLEEFIAQEMPDEHTRLKLFAQICDAVQHAHQKGVVHRDLKPSNVVVHRDSSRRDANKIQPKVLDFGIARITDDQRKSSTISSPNHLLGTLRYMSPEQLDEQHGDVDTRTDVYALGVLGFELVSGRSPYHVSALNGPKLMQSIAEDDPIRLSAINHAWRGDLDTIFAKALEKHPDRRYESAAALADDIRRYIAHEPIQARPATGWYQLRKFTQRHRAMVGGAVLAITGILFGAVFATWQAVQASIDRQEAIEARDDAAEQAAITQAVNQFLNEDILASADPEFGRRDTTILEVLENAAVAIEKRFPDSPEIEAAVRHTLGKTYFSLSENDKAETHLAQSLTLREKHLGIDHADTIQSLLSLTSLWLREGRFVEVEEEMRGCLELLESTNQTETVSYVDALTNLAGSLAWQGRLEESKQRYRNAIACAKDVIGDEHRATLNARYMLARVEARLGNHTAATVQYDDVLEVQQRVLGKEHPDTLRTMNDLALFFKETGNLDKAEVLLTQTIEIQQRVLGDDHIATIIATGNLGLVYDELQLYEKSEPIFLDVFSKFQEEFGGRHPHTLNVMNNLAASYRTQGRLTEAEEYWLKAIEIQKETLGEAHPSTLISKGGLARLYTEQELFETAEVYAKQCHAGFVELYGADHPHTEIALEILCNVYKHWGQASKAADLCSPQHSTSE